MHFDLIRAASKACLEGNLGWAASAFPTNDIKSRSTQKPHALGKHKLLGNDLIKPPKSKVRRTNIEFGHTNQPIAEMPALPSPGSLVDPSVDFEFAPDISHFEADDAKGNFPMGENEELSLEMDSHDAVPLAYIPGLFSDLDDYSALPEYTDIG